MLLMECLKKLFKQLLLQSLMCLDLLTVLPLLSTSSVFLKFPKLKYHPFSNTTKVSMKNVQVSVSVFYLY